MKLLQAILKKEGPTRNLALLVGSSAAVNSIAILFSPILTRIYSPENFGVLAAFIGLLEIFSIIACFRYNLAIPLPESDHDGKMVFSLCLVAIVIVVLLSVALIWVWGGSILSSLSAEAFWPYVWWLPVGVLLVGLFDAMNYWGIRKNSFQPIASSKFVASLSAVGIQLSIGFGGGGALGLILGRVVGQGVGSLYLGYKLFSHKWRAGPSLFNVQDMSAIAVRYRRFPLFSTWSALFNISSGHLSTFFILFFYGPGIAGLYALTRRVIRTPLRLFGASLSQVFLGAAPESHRRGQLKELTELALRRLLGFGLPVILVLGFAAPEIFHFVFGAQWREAGVYTQIISPYIFFLFLTSPLGVLATVLERQKFDLFFQILLFLSRFNALLLGGMSQNPRITIALFGGVSAVCWFGYLLWNMAIGGHNPYHVLKLIVEETFKVLPLVFPVILIKGLELGLGFSSEQFDVYVFLAASFCGVLIAHNWFKILKVHVKS